MATSVFQPSFAGGEISPRMGGTIGSDLYARSLGRCENWEPLPQGPLRKRGGTQMLAELVAGSRLVPFKTASGLDFILEFGNLEMRVYSTSGAMLLGGGGAGSNLVTNGTFSSDTAWTKAGSASISGGRAYLYVSQVFDPELHVYEPVDASVRQTFTVSAPGSYHVGWTKQSGNATVRVYLTGVGVNLTLTAPQTVTLPAVNVTLRVEASGAYQKYAYIDDVEVSAGGAPESYSIAAPWTTAQLPAVQYALETGKDRMIFVHPNVAPWQLTRNEDGTWSSGNITFSTAPADCSGTTWPGVVEIHNGRLWLAETPTEKNRVWASKVGDLFNFALGTGTATDAIDFKVSTKGAIRWLQAQRQLLLGTDQGEHYVASSSGVITPADIQVVLGSMFGSAQTQALAAGDQVLYVSPDRRKPRVIGFEYQSAGWVSHDLAFLAEHITRELIDEAHFAKAPYPAAVFVMGDGTVRVCSYDREAERLSWWRFTTPGGTVSSAAVTDGAYGSIVWLSVARDTGVFLEMFRLDDDAPYVMDSMVSRTAAAGAVSDLDHLEGHEVQIVVAGSVTTGTVDAGALTVDAEDGEIVWVGLGFTPLAKTLRRDAKNGKVRNARLGVLVNESALPLVNGQRAAERTPSTPLDTAEPALTGKAFVANLGWDGEGVVTLEQDQPLRTEIVSLFTLTEVN